MPPTYPVSFPPGRQMTWYSARTVLLSSAACTTAQYIWMLIHDFTAYVAGVQARVPRQPVA
jgi:hypothetical protein